MARAYPKVDDWYQGLDGRTLCVVAVDEDDDTVEVQYFEGEIEEFDLESWYLMNMENAAPPEDLSGTFDNLEPDYTDGVMYKND